jgi:hypothetical protein
MAEAAQVVDAVPAVAAQRLGLFPSSHTMLTDSRRQGAPV